MVWSISEDAREFVAAAEPFLRAQPARHTVELTILETLLERGPHAFGADQPLLGWWQPPGGTVAAAFLQTPPYPLLLSGAPGEAATELADALAAAGRTLPGVNASVPAAHRFADRWRQHTNVTTAVHMRTRLYRLARLVPPSPAPGGRARLAAEADRGLLVAWYSAFLDDVGSLTEESSEESRERLFDQRTGSGALMIWEDGGRPVSMAGLTQPVAGTIRVGLVYTPPAGRGRGYGGAVTAAASQAAIDAGATEVLLFTDLANPVSNALYQRLGYRPVEDRVVVSFAA